MTAGRDTPEAALAAALRAIPDISIEWRSFPDRSKPVTIEDLCAAILAALPPGWCGHNAAMLQTVLAGERAATRAPLEAEIARLRVALRWAFGFVGLDFENAPASDLRAFREARELLALAPAPSEP